MTFSLTEIASRLGVPQHRLIHLCEKGVVEPDLQDAAGRGSRRVFSERNFLEFAVALQLRRMELPVAVVRAIIYTMRAFERKLQRELPDFRLPGSLRSDSAPDLRAIVRDGEELYFQLGRPGRRATLFGGVPLEDLTSGERAKGARIRSRPAPTRRAERNGQFGGLEASRYLRLELSVTQVAQDLPLP